MRISLILCLVAFVFVIEASSISAQSYDPSLFTVCEEKSCYTMCPAGDLGFCFCISYDGEPLMVSPSDVYMKTEYFSGEIPLCPNDNPDKPAYLVYDQCFQTPGCGRDYCWYVQGTGWCENARISLHMADDPTSFYQLDVYLRSFDVTWDGIADEDDVEVIENSIGVYVPQLDITCDGVIDIMDTWWVLIISLNHEGHSCWNLIGTKESSWGVIKSMYK